MDSQSEELKPLNAANPADFKKIYDATMQMLFKISYRIVNDEEAAEDLAHDSLIKANENTDFYISFCNSHHFSNFFVI